MTFAEWCSDLETRYVERVKNQGFRNAIKELTEKAPANAGYSRYLDRQNELRRPRSDSDPLYFLEEVIAKAFYQDAFISYPDNLKFKSKKEFPNESKENCSFSSQGGSYYKKLSNYWRQENAVPITLPDCTKPHEARICWIEICSALQKEFHLFKSIKDLNRFLWQIGSPQYPIVTRGIYVRDVRELCIAYAIFHSYSERDTRALMKQGIDRLEAAKRRLTVPIYEPNVTITQQVRDQFETVIQSESFFEEAFLQKIEENCIFFPLPEKLLHWSTLKMMIEDIMTDAGVHWNNIIEDLEERDFLGRLGILVDAFKTFIKEDLDLDMFEEEFDCSGDGLNAFIMRQLAEENIMDSSEKKGWYFVENTNTQRILEYARRIYILSSMKYFARENANTSAKSVIDEINERLEGLSLREIQFHANSFGEIDSRITQDIFDWFVTEAIKFDEAQGEEEDSVSGYHPFVRFLTNDEE